MKLAFIIYIEVFLCCFAIIQGANNENNIIEASGRLTTRYLTLLNKKTDPNKPITRKTASRFMAAVRQELPDVDNWLKLNTGYAAHQLSWPPKLNENLKNNEFFKLAMAFHRFKSLVYRAKSLDLQKLYRAYRKVPRDKTLPPEPKGLEEIAQAAIDLSEHHNSIYSDYGEALGQTKEMLQLEFPSDNHVTKNKTAIVEAAEELRRRSLVQIKRNHNADLLNLRTGQQYLMDVQNKNLALRNWLEERTGYTAQQLSGPPGVEEASKKIEFWILAIAFHQYQSLRYKQQSFELDKFYRRQNEIKPKKVFKRKFTEFKQGSDDAIKLSEHHNRLFLKYKKDLNIAVKTQRLVVPGDMYVETNKSPLVIDLKSNSKRLEKLIKRTLSRDLIKRQFVSHYLDSVSQNSMESWVPKEISYSAELLSTPPDESAKYEEEFLEVACEINRYKSLWYNLRFIVFDKYARQKKGNLVEKCKKAAKVARGHSEKYKKLWEQFQDVLWNYRSADVISTYGAQEHDFYNESNYEEDLNDEDSDPDSTIAMDIFADQNEAETGKRLRDTLETYPIVYKRRKLSSQSDNHCVTPDVVRRDAYGSTSATSSERDDCPTARVPHFIVYSK